jgi:ABC-type nitrate/sulfonate/bicarbonate transport system permease component
MSPLKRIAYFLGLPVLLIAAWWLLTLGPTNFFVPKPLKLMETFWTVWASDRLWTDFLPSVIRLFIGLAASIVLGVVLGVLIGTYRWLRSFTEPILEFFRAVPPPVLVPLLMLLIGINDQMKIVVIITGAIWPVLLNTVEGVRAVDPVLSDTTLTFRITGFARLRYLVLPGASPQIMAGVRLDPDGDLRDVRLVFRTRFHHRAFPARLRHPRDVERHCGTRTHWHRALLRLSRRRGSGAGLVPRTKRDAT